MLTAFRTALREPVLHFLVAGAALFLLFDFAAGPQDSGSDDIVVSSGQIEHLTALFVKTWQRPPTGVELRGLIDNFILEEMLYREAMAIGLDQDDTIIRRRLRQKMEFLVDDFSAADPPDADLQEFLDGSPDRFRRDARISFEHVYLVDADESAIANTLAALQNDELIDAASVNSYGMLPRRFDDASEAAVSRQFGSDFTETLFALEVGRWTGPVESPFGAHLIRIDQIVTGYVPTLIEIHGEVQREWLVDRREATQQAFFSSLRDKYTITIEETVTPEL